MFNIQQGMTNPNSPRPPYIKIKGINAKQGGPLQLAIIPAGNWIFAPTQGFIAIQSAVGVTTPPTIAFGTDNPNYSDIMANTPLTGLVAGKMAPIPFRAQYPYLIPGTAVFINIVNPAVASGIYTLTALFLGVWLS